MSVLKRAMVTMAAAGAASSLLLAAVTKIGSGFAEQTSTSAPGEPGNGALFGLAVAPGGTGVSFVDDDTNTLNLLN
jgi:hypothetical protein